MISSNSIDENEIYKDLGPKASEFVQLRIQQELSTIQKDRDRVLQAMKEEILNVKQCLLYDVCSKMQSIAFSDQSNLDFYKEKCPDLFVRFSQKSKSNYTLSKKKKNRKKQIQKKPNIPENKTLEISSLLTDLACVERKQNIVNPCDDPFVKMTVNNGQKWIVQRFPLENNLTKLKYCDGSSSVITPSDIDTLNLQFEPINK